MKRTLIKDILKLDPQEQKLNVRGWVKTFRNNLFISLNDGSSQQNLQVVIDRDNTDEGVLNNITPGSSISATGIVVPSQGRGQNLEIQAEKVEVIGTSPAESYPLQPKKHSLEFLRSIAHLRFRTSTFGAIFRLRHQASWEIHRYFHENNFYYLHSPIITSSDAEGAGELFRVTNLQEGQGSPEDDFFGKSTYLTVSGQLEAELGALGLGQVYTFGPTFRAENSNTSRHLAEFWMIEPEIAFANLEENIDLAEDMLKRVTESILENCDSEFEFLENRLLKEEKQKPKHERSAMPLREKLRFIVENNFERITYTDAIEILMNSKQNKKKKFNYVIEGWGADLQSEHERYLVEKHFKKPVVITDYPAEIKAFYMKLGEDGKTVRAMDILFPGIGEIVGGSQREDNLETLKSRMDLMQIPEDELQWYLDLRTYGSVPHAGFGLGFERYLQFISGMSNIRDVIPFPRYPGHVKF